MCRSSLACWTALACLVALPGCAITYRAAAIEAHVVDADTGVPIEGVVVTANWQLVSGSFAGGEIPKGQLAVMEAVTDKNGRFYFEGWKHTYFGFAELRNKDPQILMFKPGYEPYGYEREPSSSGDYGGSTRKSPLDGKTIRLAKFRGTPSQYADQLSSLGTSLENVVRDCEWNKIPRMILALDRERKRIKAIDAKLVVTAPDVEYVESYSRRCGSAKEFFKRANNG